MGSFIKIVNDQGEEEVISVEEASKGYMRTSEFNLKTQELASKQAELNDQELKVIESLELAKLEVDLLLEDADSQDWNSMSAEDFKAATLQKQRLQAKASLIKDKLQNYSGKFQKIQEEASMEEIQASVKTLQREVPGFNQELYQEALEFAVVQLGCKPDIIKTTDAGVIRAFILATATTT